MHVYIAAQGYNVLTTDADTLADLMYQACNSEASKLAWTLEVSVRNESNPASQQDEIKFAEKVRKAADADADKKEQDKAQKITEQIISSFQLSSAIKTEDFQKKLRARADRAAKGGVKWQAIERHQPGTSQTISS